MATITTKYSIGDVVFRAGIITTKKRHPCPDCLGSRKWKATSPAGRDYEFDCPRCTASFHANSDLCIDYAANVPYVEALTIGQLRAETDHSNKVQYMCRETGIGSGSIYNECDLFPTEKEALEAAEIRATLANSSVEWIVKQYDKSLRVSDYQLSDATIKAAEAEIGRKRVALDYILNDIRDAISLEEVQRLIAKFDEAAA